MSKNAASGQRSSVGPKYCEFAVKTPRLYLEIQCKTKNKKRTMFQCYFKFDPMIEMYWFDLIFDLLRLSHAGLI